MPNAYVKYHFVWKLPSEQSHTQTRPDAFPGPLEGPVKIVQVFIIVITHRRSIAERGGCFQGRLFVWLSVCQVVCLFVNTIGLTSERLNLGWWNLTIRCIVQKSRPSSNLGSTIKGQRSRSPVTKKKRKNAAFFGSRPRERESFPHFFYFFVKE